MLGAPSMLAQHPLAQEQQHEQPGGERRLHDDQRREQQRQHLQRPTEDRQPRTQQPAGAFEQPPHECHTQVLLGRRLLGVQRLQGNP
jgi:hypothetical protein